MNIHRYLFLPVFLFCTASLVSQPSPWRDAAVSIDGPEGEGRHALRGYRSLEIDASLLETVFSNRLTDTFELLLPLPEGGFSRFRLWPSAVMPPGLAARFPRVRAFAGAGAGGARLRLERTPRGLRAMVLQTGRDYFIEPSTGGGTPHYRAFYRERLPPAGYFTCETEAGDPAVFRDEEAPPPFPGEWLRTYRLAVAATGEYTQYHGGVVEDALAAIVTTINRVNGIFERDLSVRLQLAEDNDRIIFPDPEQDPYTRNNEKRENQAVLDEVIGSRNYDVGHVFGVADRGSVSIAEIASVCVEGVKAMGSSRLEDPVGDAFDIDRVAHELGHQFGATHTFNKCGDQQGQLPVEPGGGSTIMTWAGICGDDDLQAGSDAYFHGGSIEQILRFVDSEGGCAAVTPTGNGIPRVILEPPAGHLPVRTPFELGGEASDEDDDLLLFAWEEMDEGPSTPVDAPSGTAPLFRSRPPAEDPVRVFPRLEDLLVNEGTFGEMLPFYTRPLRFRLTVRDQRGGVAWDDLQLQVSEGAGPFRVLSQQVPGGIIEGGSLLAVAWDVSRTDQSPIDAAAVDILLSADGGRSFPILLAAATPNDGMEEVLLPDTLEGDAFRVKVKATGKAFFDINDVDFSVRPASTAAGSGRDAVAGLRVFPNPAGEMLTLVFALRESCRLSIHLDAPDGRRLRTQQFGLLPAGEHSLAVSLAGLPAGLYFYRLTGDRQRRPVAGRLIRAGE